MIFRQLFHSESCTYTYLIASSVGREAIIIDPVNQQLALYIQLLKELDIRLVFAIDTHTHADHITALGHLQQKTTCQTALGEQTKAEYVSLKLRQDEPVIIDNLNIHPLYTPGHTDDSYSLLIGQRVFTGDTLLIRGTGRTDFQNGDSRQQYDSLFNKLLTLPEDTLVYPAHDYRGMTVSTIGEEKRCNPRLQVRNVNEYVDLMSSLNLPKPKLMDIAVPANLRLGL